MNTIQSVNLNGIKGFSAWQTYNALINHAPICRIYQGDEYFCLRGDGKTKEPDFEKIFDHFKSLDDSEKMALFVEIWGFYQMSQEQVTSLLRVHTDRNGIAVSQASVNNFELTKIIDMCLATCVECSKISSDLFF